MNTILNAVALLLDLLQTAVLNLRFHVYVAQVRAKEPPASPWERWAEREGKPVLHALESHEDGRL
jgi:hypothetical protein